MELDLGITKLFLGKPVKYETAFGGGYRYAYKIENEDILSDFSFKELLKGTLLAGRNSYSTKELIMHTYSIYETNSTEKSLDAVEADIMLTMKSIATFLEFRVNNPEGELVEYNAIKTPKILKDFIGTEIMVKPTDEILNLIPKDLAAASACIRGWKGAPTVKYNGIKYKTIWVPNMNNSWRLHSLFKLKNAGKRGGYYSSYSELEAFIIGKAIESGNFEVIRLDLTTIF